MRILDKFSRFLLAAALLPFAPCAVDAQTAPPVPPQADVLVFADGETLIGHVERATAASVTFKSDMAGEITADWSKIKELRTSGRFAVIEKGMKLRRGRNAPHVPQGTLTAADGKLQIHPSPTAPPASIPATDVQNVVSAEQFQRALLGRPGFFTDWKGSATAGASLVVATQNERTYTSNISLVRTEPSEDWLTPSNRTAILFSSSYGKLTQPGLPSVKTSILHGEAQRDQYFTPKLFFFGDASFDHNYAQGLDLEQTYGGGIGWTVLKTAVEELDLKAELTYIREQFQIASANQNLIGSVFSEIFDRTFVHGLLLHEQAAFQPAWNNTNAYSAVGNISLTLPVYKRLGVTAAILDSYLNNPPPGFKKNSFTFTTGATYTLP
jgi:hypothetical protein